MDLSCSQFSAVQTELHLTSLRMVEFHLPRDHLSNIVGSKCCWLKLDFYVWDYILSLFELNYQTLVFLQPEMNKTNEQKHKKQIMIADYWYERVNTQVLKFLNLNHNSGWCAIDTVSNHIVTAMHSFAEISKCHHYSTKHQFLCTPVPDCVTGWSRWCDCFGPTLR